MSDATDIFAAIGVDFSVIDECVREAARVVNAEPCELLAAKRSRTISRARQGAMWLAHRRGVPHCEITQYFDMDPSTVTYGIKQAQKRYDSHTAAQALQ